MTSVNKKKKGKNSYIVHLGLKLGPMNAKRVSFYNAADRIRDNKNMKQDISTLDEDSVC